jgi:hypothetical protein
MTRVRFSGVCAAVLIALLTLGACSGSGGTASTPATTPRDESAEVMAAAVERLVTRDHTFGGDHRFTEYLVLSRTDPSAGSPGGPKTPARPLTAIERESLAAAIAGRGPQRFIDDPSQGRTDDLQPVVEGSAIISVGEPVIDRDTALVPATLWCGNVCGVWLTYRVDRVGGAWRVTGTEGPAAVS